MSWAYPNVNQHFPSKSLSECLSVCPAQFRFQQSDPDILNGAIFHLATIMKMVLSSPAEAEFGALFHNTKEATPPRTPLEKLGHPQPPTPVLVDNSTAVGLANDMVTQ